MICNEVWGMISERLCEKQKKRTCFFGAGNNVFTCFPKLQSEYAPVCFCDNDKIKQGTQFFDLPILSFEQVLERYPLCRFYITTSDLVKPNVISFLLSNGISKSRIINHEEISEKPYISCRYLEMYMRSDQNSFEFCCSDFNKNRSPSITKTGDFETDYSIFCKTRSEIITELNEPIGNRKITACDGCDEVKNQYWFAERKIRQLNFAYRSVCNFKCVYCKIHFGKIDRTFKDDVHDQLRFFRFLESNSYIAKNAIVESAAGEITVNPLVHEICDTIRNYECWFFSNALMYSEDIEDILAMGKSRLFSSIDAGTARTFKKIKGVNAFEKVCDNIIRYSQFGVVELKYIFLPGVNDNDDDINGVLSLCRKMKNVIVVVSRDLNDMSRFGQTTLTSMGKFISALQELNINTSCPEWLFVDKDEKEALLNLMS
jgi:hypothetical protein